jgi:hypothetical protein
MARKVSPAEYKRLIDNYNREVQRHNAQVNRNIDQYNRDVKKYNDQLNRNINDYNREVRKFNSAQQARRQTLNSNIQKFNQSRTVTYSIGYTVKQSTETLGERYNDLETYVNNHELENNSSLLTDFPTQETTNSIQLYNSLSGIDAGTYLEPSSLQKTVVEQHLYSISEELGKRWRGAIYSLNPQNPDAGRHFCTSVREVFIQLIELKAPDKEVLGLLPQCALHDGRPNRRSKLTYILHKKSLSFGQMQNFVESDIGDILEMFRTLNDGTHGTAGTFTVQQLLKLKKRAEDSIIFLSALVAN